MMDAKEFYEKNKEKRFYSITSPYKDIFIPIGYNLIEDYLIYKSIDYIGNLKEEVIEEEKIKFYEFFKNSNIFIEEIYKDFDNQAYYLTSSYYKEEFVELFKLPINDCWYGSFYEVFNSLSVRTRNSKEFNLTPFISFKEDENYGGEKFSVIIDQDLNQKDISLFYLYIYIDGESIYGIFDVEDMKRIILDILNYKKYSELIALTQIIKAKDKFILDSFIKDENNISLIKDALAYYSIGLRNNKLENKEEYKKIYKLFYSLNEVIYLKDNGDILYKKEI